MALLEKENNRRSSYIHVHTTDIPCLCANSCIAFDRIKTNRGCWNYLIKRNMYKYRTLNSNIFTLKFRNPYHWDLVSSDQIELLCLAESRYIFLYNRSIRIHFCRDSNADACLAENVDPENPQISSGQTGVPSLQWVYIPKM